MNPKLHSIAMFEKSFEMQELGENKAMTMLMSNPAAHFIVDDFPTELGFAVYFAIIDLEEDTEYGVTVSIKSPSDQVVYYEDSLFRSTKKKTHPNLPPMMMAILQVNLVNIQEEGKYNLSVSLDKIQLKSIEFPIYKAVRANE